MQSIETEWLLELDKSDHVSMELIKRWRARALSCEETLAIGRHLAACATCYDLYHMTPRKSRRHGNDWSPTQLEWLRRNISHEACIGREHLDHEWLVELADGRLDAVNRRIWKMHFQMCPSCREEFGAFLASRKANDTKLQTPNRSESIN